MKVKFFKTDRLLQESGMTEVLGLGLSNKCYLNVADAAYELDMNNERKIYIFGDVFYFRQGDSTRRITLKDQAFLKQLFKAKSLFELISDLEGQYIGFDVNRKLGSVKIFCDRYAREASFCLQRERDFILSTDMEMIFKYYKPEYDQRMLAHLFSVFGWYTPKGRTIYKNVFQPKVGEILEISSKGLRSQRMPFRPLNIENYGEDALKLYEKSLRESIVARVQGSRDKIWVSSSSGWDSSIILGLLIDMYGVERVGMMTGRMLYSSKSGLVNKFEIDKVNNIGKFYGIKPKTVDFDRKRKGTVSYWKNVAPGFKSKHIYAMGGFNFSKISDGIAAVDGKGQIVFNGETSDSFHNFGFSQFGTFFHTQKSFTEYGDKMNCYLFGPSFFKKVCDGNYKRDKVFQIFVKMLEGVEFESPDGGRKDMIEKYLQPFIYGSPRVPFAKTINQRLLTDKANKSISVFPFREYMPEVLDGFNEKNMYSWFIYLYQSFHSQGSTVGMHKHGMAINDHKWRAPFNDYRIIDILSKAPESWGRGLDFNHTKFPIKWIAKNRIKFPYDLLQEGPHSYLYDVIEGYSLGAETVYRSAFTPYYKELLGSREYRKVFQPEFFDMKYVDNLVNDFIAGKEVRGVDFYNLLSLITFVEVGWY